MKHCLFSIYSPQQIRQQETLIFWLDNDVSRTSKRPIKNIYILFFLSWPLELPGGGWGWGVADGEGRIPEKVEVLTYNRDKRDSVSVRPSLFFAGGLKFDSQVRLGP